MSMNPQAEDFERLAIRWADTPQATRDYPSMIAAITAFPELYAKNRDALPQNDADRAFALVTRACTLLDRYVVMAESDQAAAKFADEAASLIDEALKLDPVCYDAVRIHRYLARPTRDEMVAFLSDGADEVYEMCRSVSRDNGIEPPQGRLSMSVYMRPYLRWLFDLANEQLGCGRYGRSLEVCGRLLELDAADVVGARHIAAFDYAKLEDAEGLAALIGRFPDDADNAWFLLARCFMAYKQRRLDDAAAILHGVVRRFPRAGCTLSYQDELPAGVFGHLEFAPGSEDELYVAVSEGAVILDENCGDYLSPLSDWVVRDPVVAAARAAEEARMGGAGSGGAAEPFRQSPSTGGERRAPAAPSGLAGDADGGEGALQELLGGTGGFDDITCIEELLDVLDAGSASGTAAPGPSGAPGSPAGPDSPADPDASTAQGR